MENWPQNHWSDDPAYRGPRRHIVPLAASVAAHAALIAAIIYLIPPVHRPTSIVLAYLVEIGDRGAGAALAGQPAGQPSNSPSVTIAPSIGRPPRRRHRRSADDDAGSIEQSTAGPGVRKLAALPSPAIKTDGVVPVYSDAAGAGRGAGDNDSRNASLAMHGGTPSGTGGAGRSGGGAGGFGTAGAYARYGDNPLPAYPARARRHGEQGTVMLHVLVAADGSVERVELAQSSGFDALDRSALETVRTKWRFVPARRGGIAVESWVLVPIRFTLAAADAR